MRTVRGVGYRMGSGGHRHAARRSLAAKLLLGQVLVDELPQRATLLVVALLVGPKVFDRHIEEALGSSRETTRTPRPALTRRR